MDIDAQYDKIYRFCYYHMKNRTLAEDMKASTDDPLDAIALRLALEKLSDQDRELILLRYVNKEPVGFLCEQYGLSRFALHRRLKRILFSLKEELRE